MIIIFWINGLEIKYKIAEFEMQLSSTINEDNSLTQNGIFKVLREFVVLKRGHKNKNHK